MAKAATGLAKVQSSVKFICVVCFATMVNLAQAVQVTDDTGRVITLDQVAQRIVSLVPHATEMLYRVGAGPQMVGATEYSDYPEAAKALPRVGNFSHLNVEALLALKPDLVIIWGKYDEKPEYQQLEKLGLKVFYSHPHSIPGIAKNLQALAKLTGHEARGQRQADLLLEGFARLKQQHANTSPLRVFFQVWHTPLMTVNGNSFIASVVNTCGGYHLFADETISAPQVSMEAILALDPQVIISGGSKGESKGESKKSQSDLDHWQSWPSISAVIQGNLFTLEADLIQRPTFRLLEGATRLCALLDQARKKLTNSQQSQ